MHLACLFSNRTTLALTMLAATVCQPAAFCQTQIVRQIEPQVRQTNEHVPIASDLRTLATTIQITKPGAHRRLESAADLGQVHTLERLELRQDLLETREETVRSLMRTNLEVDYTIAKIDGELNLNTQLLQALESKRDKNVMLTSILTQLTNGVFGDLSCSYTAVSARRPVASYTDAASFYAEACSWSLFKYITRCYT